MLRFFVVLTPCVVPVVRAADDAKAGTGEITISEEDPCLIIGHGTRFTTEFKPRMQILLPKSVGSNVAEVVEIISDTQLRVRKEFSGTARLRERIKELQASGKNGFSFQCLPFVDQHQMYQHVYQSLTEGGAICIFPEGRHASHALRLQQLTFYRRQSRPDGPPSLESRRVSHGVGRNGEQP